MHKRALACFLGIVSISTISNAQTPLQLLKTVPLPGVTGKFDHFAVDLAGNRLFAAATGNHSVEVIDLSTGNVVQSIRGLGKPHGLAWIPETSRLYVADGSQADLKVYEGPSLKQTADIKLSEDADDMVYDEKTKLLYVGHGGSAAAPSNIAVIDTSKETLIAELPVATHPEGLDIDKAQDRIFVNIADAAEVVVIDGASHAVSSTWKLGRAKDNVPLAYDEEHQLLFVACRTPARLLVLDGRSGKEIADLAADAGIDDAFHDPSTHRIYLIAGSGSINAYEVDDSGHVRAVGTTPTINGAKTGLLVSGRSSLYVGVPGTPDKPSEIRVYSTAVMK